ncbi:MAG: 2-hydroxyacyl-CoA dehydratase [Proteobacteria bacterium]|nr:2-hydroxyacyl-CoA dehydratase [Pseudomonadota bacterium]
MNEKSTLGQLMPPLMRLMKGLSILPGSLPRPITNRLSQKAEMALPALKANTAYFKILQQGLKGKRKVVIHPFNFPPELLHAMDLVPVFIELLSTIASMAPEKYPDNIFKYLDYGYENGLPGTLCAGQLGGAGALLYGDWPKPDLILSGAPGFCDVNSKILEYTARTLDIPLFHVDMSAYHDERAVAYYRQSFRDVISRLEEFTGNKLDPKKLKQTVENTNRVIELYNEISGLQSVVPSPVPNLYAFLNVAVKFTVGGRKEAIPIYEAVLNSAKKKMKVGEGALPNEKVRCLMLYTSIYFDDKFNDWLEKNGVALIMDILSYFPLTPVDTTSKDTMIDGLAEMALNFPMARQMKGPMDETAGWAEDMIFLAKKYKADCCIFSGNPACKRAHGSLRLLTDRLKKEVGIPTLNLEADSWDRRVTSMPAIKAKILDFIETLE